MSINLSKGQKIDLTKTNPSVKVYGIGLSWDANANVGADFDADVSAFILGADGKLLSDNHIVFYNNLVSEDNAVTHSGDNRTGDGDGDDETLTVDFSKLDPRAERIVFVVTIFDYQQRNQNFGQINNAAIRIYDNDTKNEILKFDLNEDYSVETSLEFGELYKKDGEWKFNAIGAGMTGGLQEFVNKYQ